MSAAPRAEAGFAIPQTFPNGRVDLALVRRVVTRAEALGFHSLWTQEHFGNAALARRVAVWGSPARCADTLRQIVAHGARLLILNPVFDEAPQLERAAAELIPAALGDGVSA